MPEQPINVLFLCNHNSARSILAEAILNATGAGLFRAFSAGSTPRGEVNPDTLRFLRDADYDTAFARSKSWDEFSASDAPRMHFVITVCDDAAAEVCPIWPGQPVSGNWGVPDPSKTRGTAAEVMTAFRLAHDRLAKRIGRLTEAKLAALGRGEIGKLIDNIGKTPV